MCIAGVLLCHVTSSDQLWLEGVARRGWYGVDVFFVLSGFLITWILANELESSGTIRLSRFYLRRAMRLQPAFVSCFVATCVGHYLFNRPDFNAIVPAIPFILTYTLNLAVAAGVVAFPPFGQTWSLCIEEQFYLIWPWIMRKLGLRGALRFVLWAVVTIVVLRSAIYCFLNWGHLEAPSVPSVRLIFFATFTRIDTIFVGCALAIGLRMPRFENLLEKLRNCKWFPEAALVVALLAIAWGTGGGQNGGWRNLTVGSTIMSGLVAVVILGIFLQPSCWLARILSLRPMVFVGRISYGIYLFQPVVWNAVSPFLRLRHQLVGSIGKELLALALVWFGSIALAWLHYSIVEVRVLSLRESVEGSGLARQMREFHPVRRASAIRAALSADGPPSAEVKGGQ